MSQYLLPYSSETALPIFTKFYNYAYSVGLRIGYYLFSIPLSSMGCSPLYFYFFETKNKQ